MVLGEDGNPHIGIGLCKADGGGKTAGGKVEDMFLVLLLVQHREGQGEGCDVGDVGHVGRVDIVAGGTHEDGPHIQAGIQFKYVLNRPGGRFLLVSKYARPSVEKARLSRPRAAVLRSGHGMRAHELLPCRVILHRRAYVLLCGADVYDNLLVRGLCP